MANCAKCGATNNNGVKFCSSCGAPMEVPVQSASYAQQNSFTARVQNLNNTADTTAEYDAQDVQQNKGMAVLSYFGPLVLVPILAAPQSRFARFHANQGLVMLISEVVYGIVESILLAILGAIFPWNWSYGYLGGRGAIYGILSTVLGLFWILFTVLAVLGIINAVKGRVKELPVIGKIRILK